MTNLSTPAGSLTIAARLERLPLNRFHWRFVSLVALGCWLDFYDLFMMSYIGAGLQQSGFLTLHQFSLVIAAGFGGMFVGTVFFGLRSDRMGRRSTFVATLLVYSLFSLVGAFSPSAFWLIVSRFLAGIGIGAELVVIDTYVTEIAPSYARGRFVAFTQVVGFTSVPFVAILARLLVPTHFLLSGWRWIMIIGGSGAIFAWYLRRSLPESPRWLESQGQLAEAEKIMSALEVESGVSTPTGSSSSSLPKSQPRKAPSLASNFRELWSRPYWKRTSTMVIFQTLQTLGYYGFANWVPTFLLKRGISLVTSLNYALLIALVAPFGALMAALTSDRLERKWTIVVLALLIALFGIGFASWTTPVLIVLSGALITFSNNWFSAIFHAYQTELFPTRIRATGVGFTYSWSRLSAVLNSFLIGVVLVHGVPAVIALLASALVGVALIIAIGGPRTNREVLEDLSQ